MYKKLLTHTLIYGLSPYIPKLLGIFILPIITKDLTEVDYGIYGVILAYVAAIEVFKDLGLNLILYNSFTKMPYQHKWLWRSIYGFLIFWNFLYTILAGLLLYITIPAEAHENSWLIVVLNLLPIITFGPTSQIGKIFFQMNEMPRQIAIRTIIFGILTLILNLYTISFLKLGYMGWFWTNCIVGILTNLSFWIPINLKYKITPIFNFKKRLIKENLKVTLPTIPHYYSNYIINTSDKVILDLMNVDSTSIGKYNFAGTFASYFNQLGLAIGQAARPFFNTFFKSNNFSKLREMIFTIQILFFSITFTVSIWLKEIFSLLVKNEALSSTYSIAILLIMATNYRPMYLASTGLILYNENTKKLLHVTMIASIISILLNIILIPKYKIMGAVITSFVSLMYMGYSAFFFKEFKKITIKFYPVFWLICTIILTITAYFISEISIIYKSIITIFVCIIGFLMLRKFIKYKTHE
ncbi:MAG: oligosaccharide flippase family protein [Petrimonas sp.]|nr:oligosaccharide flippase family protein [Petrimonas sp.]MEA5080305.1 oligosaccharide flippase family protein [Dysgonamonadaceae bacterium]